MTETENSPIGSHSMTPARERYEFKYKIPLAQVAEIRKAILPYVLPDPHANGGPFPHYTVRNIYFDSRDLRAYHDRQFGMKRRKKLRVRTYGGINDIVPVFFEIKHKLGKRRFKERVEIPRDQVAVAIDPVKTFLPGSSAPPIDDRTLSRFRSYLETLELEPAVLVAYEREAYMVSNDPAKRITIDEKIRTRPAPGLDELFLERDLISIDSKSSLVEFKFDDGMPLWMREIVSHFGLRRISYSKFSRAMEESGLAG